MTFAKPQREGSGDYDVLLKEAVRLMHAEDYALAYERVAEAMHLHPSRPEAMNLLGVVCEATQDRSGALRHYRAALALDPGFEAARSNLDAAVRGLLPWKPIFF